MGWAIGCVMWAWSRNRISVFVRSLMGLYRRRGSRGIRNVCVCRIRSPMSTIRLRGNAWYAHKAAPAPKKAA
jgi:hypothetical protein